ncbi:hypothetical protein TcG_04347, partial [Trypanosoma cruzi]
SCFNRPHSRSRIRYMCVSESTSRRLHSTRLWVLTISPRTLLRCSFINCSRRRKSSTSRSFSSHSCSWRESCAVSSLFVAFSSSSGSASAVASITSKFITTLN